MAVKNRDQIGWIHCPICETRATVHACAVGRGGRAEAKYWRCECGTIQPWKPGGQRFIAGNFELMEAAANSPGKPRETPPVDDQKPAAETGSEYTPGELEPLTNTEQKPSKRGFLESLFSTEGEEE